MKKRNIIAFLIAVFIGALFYGLFIKNDSPEEVVPNSQGNDVVLDENNSNQEIDFGNIKIDKNSEKVQIERLKKGSGEEVEKGDKVEIHYTGRLVDGTKFDSSRDRNQPLSFTLGRMQVVPGMEAGVEGMKVGEQRRIFIPPTLGYGDKEKGPIPPNSILVFDVELLSIK